MAVDHAEVVVKARVVWSWSERGIPIHRLCSLRAEVPLAHTAGRITGVLQDTGDGRLAVAQFVSFTCIECAGHPALAPWITAGQKAEAGRRTGTGRCVRVGKPPPLAREPVAIRCADFRRPVTAQVAVTHVVRHDEDNVRT